jgi:hypothetical protein
MNIWQRLSPILQVSLHCLFFFFHCGADFYFDTIPFVNSHSYFLSYWNTIQKVLTCDFIFKSFPNIFLS